MAFWQFGAGKDKKQKQGKSKGESRAAGARLTRDYVIDGAMALLESIPDPEKILIDNGMTRGDLKALESDTEISTALETRLDAVLATPWRLEGQQGEPLDWLTGHLQAHADQLITDIWSAVPYGFSVLELVWEPPSSRRGIVRAAKKPIDWFSIDRDGALKYHNQSTGDTEALDIEFKYVLTRRKPDWENPYGVALLSRLYWPFFFTHNLWRFWMQFLERFGDPLIIGKGENPSQMAEDLLALGFESVATVGQDDDISAVTSAGGGEFERAEQALARQVAKVILGQTLTTDVGKSGSFAAAKVHNEVRADKRNSDIRMVSAGIQKIIGWIWDLNGFAGKPPVFVMEDNTGLEPARAERDKNLMDGGVVLTEDYFLRAYDFQPGEIESIEPPGSRRGAAGGGALTGGNARALLAGYGTFSAPGRLTLPQQAVEAMTAQLLEAGGSFGISEARLKEELNKARSFEDLAARLSALANEPQDNPEVLALSGFAAQVVGYVAAEKGDK